MKVVGYIKNDFCVLNKEYLKFKGNKVVTSQNPLDATVFNSADAARVMFSKIKKGLDGECKTQSFSRAKLNWKNVSFNYRELPYVDFRIRDYDKSMTREEVLDFWFKYYTEYKDQSLAFNPFDSYPDLWQLYDHLHDVNEYHKQDDNSVKYVTYNIKSSKNSSFETFVNELSNVLDRCTLMSEDGYKVFPIFDHELSQYESRSLHYKGPKDCKIIGSYYTKFEGTLEECFNEIKKEYYYET